MAITTPPTAITLVNIVTIIIPETIRNAGVVITVVAAVTIRIIVSPRIKNIRRYYLG